MKKVKKPVLVLTVVVLILSIVASITVLASVMNNRVECKRSSPWEYALFSNSLESDLNIFVDGVHIEGDIHSNGNIVGSSRSFSVYGTAEAYGASSITAQGTYIGENIDHVKKMQLADVYGDFVEKAGTNIRDYGDLTEVDLNGSIISNGGMELNFPNEGLTYTIGQDTKIGAFGAGFLTEMYEDPAKWAEILPMLNNTDPLTTDENGKKDLLELVDKSVFIGVQEQGVSSSWKNYDKLPGPVFTNNFNTGYVSAYISQVKTNNPVFGAASFGTVVDINASWDKSTINPPYVNGAEKIRIMGGNATLNGEYANLKEIRIESYGATQLTGSFPDLEYICMTTYANLNLAGEFPSLKGVYMPGGQLLIGTAAEGFSADNAVIINENGNITVFTAKDIQLKNSSVSTNSGLAIRGAGKSAAGSNFTAENSIFCARAITLGDMNDVNSEYFEEIPSYFSQSGISVVNCKFSILQGAFTSRGGEMVLSGSEIDVLRGFLFSQSGINGIQTLANEGVYVEGGSFNQSVGLENESYRPNGTGLGKINSIECAALPVKYHDISGSQQFLTDVVKIKNENNVYVDKYQLGSCEEVSEDKIFILAEGDITINAENFNIDSNKTLIIASHNGDIEMNGAKSNFNGILYAPNGEVRIEWLETRINGGIYADSISVSGMSFEIQSVGDDLFGLNLIEKIIIDETNLEYMNNLRIYMLENTFSSLSGSVYTQSDVTGLAYSVSRFDASVGTFLTPVEGSVNAGKVFEINNIPFEPGVNRLVVKAVLANGKTLEKSLDIMYYDADEIDRNDDDEDGLPNWYEDYIDSIRPVCVKVWLLKPEGWEAPNLYYYTDNDDTLVEWPGEPMEEMGDGWYRFVILDYATAKVRLNDGTNQIPSETQEGFTVSGEMWYENGQWYEYHPENCLGETVYGDVTGDGRVKFVDILFISQYIEGQLEFNESQIINADVNADQVIDSNDIALIREYIAGNIFEFPAEEISQKYKEAEYEYDKLGRLTKVIYDAENYIEYEYDANGNIKDVKTVKNGQ